MMDAYNIINKFKGLQAQLKSYGLELYLKEGSFDLITNDDNRVILTAASLEDIDMFLCGITFYISEFL